MSPCTCGGGQRAVCRDWFFPSSMWVSGIKLGSLGLVTCALSCWAILPAHIYHFKEASLSLGNLLYFFFTSFILTNTHLCLLLLKPYAVRSDVFMRLPLLVFKSCSFSLTTAVPAFPKIWPSPLSFSVTSACFLFSIIALGAVGLALKPVLNFPVWDCLSHFCY